MTLDGKIATATLDSKWISSEKSRALVHQIRGRVDAIVVGSGTAIADDPLLTARPAGARVATRVVIDSRLVVPFGSQLVQSAKTAPVLIASADGVCQDRVDALRSAGCAVVLLDGATHSDRLRQLLMLLAERGATNVLVEGGGRLLGELFDQKLVDEVHVFVAPRIVGGTGAVSPIGGKGVPTIAEACHLESVEQKICDGDIYLQGRVSRC